MSSLGWLHLSDFHQGLSGQAGLWPNVREQVFDDLRKLHDLCGPWQVVFFSGDLTQKGDTEEFKRVSSTLVQLWDRLKDLGSSPMLLAVPGNHDLVRPSARQAEVRLLSYWEDESEVREEFWRDAASDYRGVVDGAFANYLAWWQSHPLPRPESFTPGLLPGDFAATIEIDGARVGVLGLNTAFLQLGVGPYRGKLAVGTAQFQQACGGDGAAWARSHDACFLLSHHPPDWLSPSGQQILNGEIASPGRFAAHLFGHMHEGRSQTLCINGVPPSRYWQAYSLFGLETYDNGSERRHGFSAGQIRFAGGRVSVRLWPRSAVRRPEGFWRLVPDVSAFDLADDNGTRPEELITVEPVGRMPAEISRPEYSDFDLVLSGPTHNHPEYAVASISGPGFRTDSLKMELPRIQVDEWVSLVKLGRASIQTARLLGKALFEALFPWPIRNLWTLHQERLRYPHQDRKSVV
jgi:hypothetical protein